METPAKFKSIVDALDTMTVLDLHELVKHLEENSAYQRKQLLLQHL